MAREKTLKRSEADEKYLWDLKPIFKSDSEWERHYLETKQRIRKMDSRKGTLSNSKALYETIREMLEEKQKVEKAVFYAKLKTDEDTALTKYQEMEQKAHKLGVDFASKISFFSPEVLRLSDAQIKTFYSETPELKQYKRFLEDVTRLRKHTLSEHEEKLLAESSKMASAAEDVFMLLDNADFKFGKIRDEKGKEAELTHSTYQLFLKSRDRKVREDAYRLLYSKYFEHKNTLGALVNASVNKYVFYSKARNYNDSIESALYPSEIDRSVYENLIESVNEALPVLHDYLKLRKKVLGLEEQRMWDISVPLAEEPKAEYSFEEAAETVKKALSPLGDDYISNAEKMWKERRIDILPTENKRGGAFSWAVYGTRPHILLNFEGTFNDVSTLAHEMGHAMHSHYSIKNQPPAYSDYTTFCAEITSMANEQLLAAHMLETADVDEKIFLLTHLMDNFRTGIFRQTQFSEFEKTTHSMVENDESLNAENLCRIYSELNSKYYGKDTVTDREISIEWARIPHFYWDFYVYTYATGIMSATIIADNVLKKGEGYAREYVENFLSAGSSKPPLEILQSVGIDLTSKKTMQKALETVQKTLGELEKLLGGKASSKA